MDLELLKTRIRSEEGWRAQVYDDATGRPIVPGSQVKGHPTVGYGFALDVAGLTREEAEVVLQLRAVRVMRDLQRLVPFWATLDDVRQLALAEMAYQMGVAGLLGFRHALQALATGDAERAAAEFLNSEWARHQAPARAARVAAMVRTGKLPGEA